MALADKEPLQTEEGQKSVLAENDIIPNVEMARLNPAGID